METKHTPTPAEAVVILKAAICDPDDRASIHGSDGDLAVIDEAMPSIVRACNAHEDLVAALERAAEHIGTLRKELRLPPECHTLVMISDAITKARGESSHDQ